MSFSLQRRLLRMTGLILGLVLLGFGLLTWTSLRAELRQELDNALFRDLCLTAPDVGIEYWLRRGRRVDPDEDETSFLDPSLRRGVWLQAWDEEGQTVLRSRHLGGEALPRGPAELAVAEISAPQRERMHFADVTLPDGGSGRLIAGRFEVLPPLGLPLAARSRSQPRMDLSLVHSTAAVDRPLAVLRFWLLLSLIGCLLLSWWTIGLVLHRSLGPLRRLREQIKAQDASRPQGRFGSEPQLLELRPVEEQLNRFVERVQKAMRAEQDFAGQAAHELGNPLAGLRATLEVALAREREGTRDAQALTTCLQVVLEMQQSVQGLLDLARLETADQRLRLEEIEVQGLLRDSWAAQWSGGQTASPLQSELPEAPLCIVTDPRLLRRVCDNLLANALAYRSAGTPIRLSLVEAGGEVRIEVCNRVDALPEGFAERAFETFWRGHAAAPQAGHAGIGLSLARRCAMALGGSLELEADGGGVCFRLRLRSGV